jgi:hypothetical protein
LGTRSDIENQQERILHIPWVETGSKSDREKEGHPFQQRKRTKHIRINNPMV